MGTSAPRVLILTASYGSGHNRAARALAAAFAAAGAQPRVVDHFRELVHPAFDRLSRSLYYWILRWAPPLWGGAYWLGDQLAVSSPLLLGMSRLGARKLRRLLHAESPDFVVSVHPTPAGALSELRARGLCPIPHATVFTDFVAHTQWIHPGVDWYCVPSEAIKNDLTARGVPRERVVVTGVPIAPDFLQPVDRASARLALGLSSRLPVLLVMAGSLGSLGGLMAAARVISELPVSTQALFVTGQDPRLAAKLKAMFREAERRIRVFDYTDSVRQLMAAADLLVSKAGGVTLAEALAAELPIVCFGSLPGQESRNERFVGMTGVALRAQTAADLRQALSLALAGPEILQNLRVKIREVRRPDAARAVVERVLGSARRIAERAS
ncbi:MAG: glycosyltransferase [Candidatus Rokubacteria bacterium]|nr:glycosyltransferase [Candidatus Rokubacteria bacterium]